MKGLNHAKRSASEPVDALLGDEKLLDARAKRPFSTSLGALFVFGRAVAGLLWLSGFAMAWDEIASEASLDAASRPIIFWSIMSIGLICVLVLLGLTWAIWRGSNAARVLVMFGLTLSTTTAAISYFAQGEEITIHTTLLTVAFDILALLALSSRDSRAWSRRSSRRAERA